MPTLHSRVRHSSRARRDADRQQLRELILRTATELLVDKGYAQFSLRQVAERIGYTATTLYRYFRNKEDLVFAVLEGTLDDLAQELEAAAASSADPYLRLGRVGWAYFEFALDHPVQYRAMFLDHPGFLLGSRMGSRESRLGLLSTLERAAGDVSGKEPVTPRDGVSLGRAFLALLHGIALLALLGPLLSRPDAEKALIEGLELLVSGVRSTLSEGE